MMAMPSRVTQSEKDESVKRLEILLAHVRRLRLEPVSPDVGLLRIIFPPE